MVPVVTPPRHWVRLWPAIILIGFTACTSDGRTGDKVPYETTLTFRTSAGDAVLEPDANVFTADTDAALAAEWRRFAPSEAPQLRDGEIGLVITSGQDRGNSGVTDVRRVGDELTVFVDVHELSECGDGVRTALLISDALLVRIETQSPVTARLDVEVRDGCGTREGGPLSGPVAMRLGVG